MYLYKRKLCCLLSTSLIQSYLCFIGNKTSLQVNGSTFLIGLIPLSNYDLNIKQKFNELSVGTEMN